MRILATNPDTIGDLVLRQPLYAALTEAGHDLMLVVRPLLEPLVSMVAPGAAVAACRTNVYDPSLEIDDESLDEVVEAARRFDPELFLVTPYQWTTLEERLAEELPDVRRIAMSGKPFSDPGYGPTPPSTLDPQQIVEVAEEAAEVRKNELLAGAVLQRALRLPDPRLEASPAQLRAGEAQLARLGLEADAYWVACIGHSATTGVRNWRPERWSEVLATWVRTHGRRFLLVGQESEAEVSEEIRARMGEHSGAAVIWSGRGDGELDLLLGLIARSAGYVGRDTGPMHVAAAMGKPVLAIFGGGTWPRFLPCADKSVSITVGVPCAGCNWKCHLPESFCIGEVPVDEALKAVDELEAGTIHSRTVRILTPSTELLGRIGRLGAAAARERLTALSVKRREHMEQTQSIAEALERAARRAGQADQLEEQLRARGEEMEALRTESNRRESNLKQRLAAAENMFRAREIELQAQQSELRVGMDAMQREKDDMQSQLAVLEQKIATLEQGDGTRMQQLEAEWSGKLAAVQDRSRQVNEQFLRAQAEAADLRLKLDRAVADQQALVSLTRQQEQQLATLRSRLLELMASRWRRYGQRLRLCMTMPWEQQYQNGKHDARS
jgi:ADP-heptose:LPS heptosyltransferase